MKLLNGIFLTLVVALVSFCSVNLSWAECEVTNSNDSGPGSLRQAILDLNAGNTQCSSIVVESFGLDVSIILESPLPPLQKSVLIKGSKQGFLCEDNSSPPSPKTKIIAPSISGKEWIGFDISQLEYIELKGFVMVGFKTAVNIVNAEYVSLLCNDFGGYDDNSGAPPFNFNGANIDNSHNLRIYGNKFIGVVDEGLHIENSSFVEIDNNDFFSIPNLPFGYDSIRTNNASHIQIINNRIGINADGSSATGKSGAGIWMNNAKDIDVIGNIISLNYGGGINFGYFERINILDNMIGVGANGKKIISLAKQEFGIRATLGKDIVISHNTISDNLGDGILVQAVYSGLEITDNKIGVESDIKLTPAGNGVGIRLGYACINEQDGVIGFVKNNIIAHNLNQGLTTNTTGKVLNEVAVEILNNVFFHNGKLGIDLNGDDVTANDSGDHDNGPNDLLNYPDILSITKGVGSSVLKIVMRVDIDQPLARVQFFANPLESDPSGNGEGQIFIGQLNVSASSKYKNFNLTLPAGITDSDLKWISATATANGKTSEFSRTKNVLFWQGDIKKWVP